MNIKRLTILLVAVAVSAGGAQAQNFFERLFGVTPSRPAPPAYEYQQPAPVRQRAPPPERLPYDDEPPARRTPAAPVQARATSIRAPADESVLNRELKQNGSNGSLRISRTASGAYRAEMTIVGRRSALSPETCAIKIGEGGGAALVSQARPEGAQRLQLADTTCPLQLDLLDEAVLVKGPGEVCVFEQANCQVDASGMWGPDATSLLARARDYEATRGSADKIVRENFKALTQRARPEAVRPIVAEQAAFSAEREQVCKSFAREGSHSFCNARYTEARALSLATRLGLTVTAANQSGEGRRRTRVIVENPDEDDPPPR
jgi:hypothetical protein